MIPVTEPPRAGFARNPIPVPPGAIVTAGDPQWTYDQPAPICHAWLERIGPPARDLGPSAACPAGSAPTARAEAEHCRACQSGTGGANGEASCGYASRWRRNDSGMASVSVAETDDRYRLGA